MALVFGGQGVTPSSRGQPSTQFSLQAGEVSLIPAGSWFIDTGLYANLQKYDPITTTWRNVGAQGAGGSYVNADGFNYRVGNLTGCAVGALITNAGSGYTSAPTVTASAGASVWSAIVGGAVSTTVTVANGGSNYRYPPLVFIQAPGSVGIQATATCALTNGAVSSVTVTNQGAGYLVAPTIVFINDPRDTTGGGAIATTALTGAGTVTGLLATNHGTTLTSVPTLSFTGGGGSSAAATAIMDFTLTAYAVSTGGTYTAASVVEVAGIGGIVAGSAAYTNPDTQAGLVRVRRASIVGALSSTAITATGQVLVDGGHFQAVPSLLVTSTGAVTTGAGLTATVGGLTQSITMIAA